jgi:GR25 family glycosyltransferase involved in LPS biosynthesis
MFLKVFVPFLLLLIVIASWTQNKRESFDNITTPRIHSYIINLDKNKERLNNSMYFYNSSDFSKIPITRYSAVVGANLNPAQYLSEDALVEFNETARRGYRTKHYQLTAGAIGCYLSHVNLFKQLVADENNDYYLIFEDDIKVDAKGYSLLQKTLSSPPNNWDMILLGFSKIHQYAGNPSNGYTKVKSFWGMNGYLINKSGAQTFLNYSTPIDAQIDNFISYLAIKGLFNVYAIIPPVIFPSSDNLSDIQINIFPVNLTDAFTYREVFLGSDKLQNVQLFQ